MSRAGGTAETPQFLTAKGSSLADWEEPSGRREHSYRLLWGQQLQSKMDWFQGGFESAKVLVVNIEIN